MTHSIVRLMSMTEADFFRLLRRLEVFYAFTMEAGRAVFMQRQGRAEILIVPQPDLKIGSLLLPVIQVEISFDDMPGDEAAAFLARFDRTFQRGGG